MTTILQKLEEKKHRLDQYKPFPSDFLKNFHEWFKIELTYTSNAIEGNTLSRAETALIVEKGITVEGKTFTEYLEAVNHAEAYQWVIVQSKYTRKKMSEQTILDLHRLILQKIDDAHAGRYRTVSVRIAGSRVILPNAAKVPDLMQNFSTWLTKNKEHPVLFAADAHFTLVSIHPFVDGNGRTARLFMNLLLMQHGYPPAIIRKEDRRHYITSIEKAQLGGSLDEYYALICESLDRSLDIYLDALEEKKQEKSISKKQLLKIGELATLTNETVPTIRHWTYEGLLQVKEFTPGGYQLYDQETVRVVRTIRKLQKVKRWTLAEIKKSKMRLI